MLRCGKSGQILSGSLMDYALPRADDLPSFRGRSDTRLPSNANRLGVKGSGQAGAIAAPATIMNAVMNALAPLGVQHLDMPATPSRVWQAIRDGPACGRFHPGPDKALRQTARPFRSALPKPLLLPAHPAIFCPTRRGRREPASNPVSFLPDEDYVGSDNPVRAIESFLCALDLAKLMGQPPYDPADLLKLYLYDYVNQVRSSRRLEREAWRTPWFFLGEAEAEEGSTRIPLR